MLPLMYTFHLISEESCVAYDQVCIYQVYCMAKYHLQRG